MNGQKVAEVRLIAANAGPELMQLAATNNAQMTFAGVPPAMAAIDKGTPIKVLHPINNEGSGLVATARVAGQGLADLRRVGEGPLGRGTSP